MIIIEALKKIIKNEKTIMEYDNVTDISDVNTIKFGSFFQKNDSTKDEIEWLLLSRTEKKILLLSKYVLEYKKFNENSEYIEIRDTTLYRWLWNDFLNEAFSEDEQEFIGNITCPSLKDIKEYFNISSPLESTNEILKAYVTDYAKAHSDDYSIKDYGTWWLADNGWQNNCALFVEKDGRIPKNGAYVDFCFGVRPIILLDLK